MYNSDTVKPIVFWKYDNLCGCLYAELESIDYEKEIFRPKGYDANFGTNAIIVILPNSIAKNIISNIESLESQYNQLNKLFRNAGKEMNREIVKLAKGE